MTDFSWHSYKYYPYEIELASREIEALLGREPFEHDKRMRVNGEVEADAAKRLTYFASFKDERSTSRTTQSMLEDMNEAGKKRQSTRYGVHGLHEYRGKFNPQIAKALLNIFGVADGKRVLDPFCGSGTTLVECVQLGAEAVGTDLNPLAVFIANAKLSGLRVPAAKLRGELSAFIQAASGLGPFSPIEEDARGIYLLQWFEENILAELEAYRRLMVELSPENNAIFLTIMSDMLREYSQQDPNDLRIRRRTSPIPDESILSRFERDCRKQFDRIEMSQSILGSDLPQGRAILRSSALIDEGDSGGKFDAAITSPPYAMALPYIDTQRLSLVWLDLLPSDQILQRDSELIGSREMRGVSRKALLTEMLENVASLPEAEALLCQSYQQKLRDSDGFRRRAVPMLLYRYFSGMADVFRNTLRLMNPGASFALVVGHNHTVLGGDRQDIDTPRHLANLAVSEGWRLVELLPLQTYKRYGYHAANAVTAETLIILRKDQ